MKTLKQLFVGGAALVALSISVLQPMAAPLGSAFTYQGRLNSSGSPANGFYDLQFRLCDAALNGNQVAQPLTNSAVAVSNGLFTVTLDFGPGLYYERALWLWISVRTNGAAIFTDLNPRQPLTTAPFALYAPNAGAAASASIASTVAAGSVSSAAIQAGAVTSNNIADGTIIAADLSYAVASNTFWRLNGNTGTGASQFLGTTDNQALNFNVNNHRVLRLDPGASGVPNVLAGYELNRITAGIKGATIAGGGGPSQWNAVTNGDFGTIGGGYANTVGEAEGTVGGGLNNAATGNKSVVSGGAFNRATQFASTVAGGFANSATATYSFVGGGSANTNGGGISVIVGGASNTNYGTYAAIGGGRNNTAGNLSSTVPGGAENEASGSYTFAAGQRAKALHTGAFVWADFMAANFTSTDTNQFLIRAGRGVGINTNNPQAALHVNGTIIASNFVGTVAASQLSGVISSNNIAAGSITTIMLAAGSVGSNQLASGAVTTGALADGAVTAAKVVTVSNWSTLKITKPAAVGWEEFGRAVAPVGTNLVLIGAHRDNTGAEGAGAAYLFTASGRLVTSFTNPTPAVDDNFGGSLTAVGSRFVLIGAPGDDAGATNAGRAYLFGTNGTLLTTFICPNPATNGSFGGSVAALGTDRVLIGSPGKNVDDWGVTNYGMAFLFRTNGALLASFTNPISGDDVDFGAHVAVVGSDRVFISAERNYWGRGAVHMFNTNGILLHTFTDPTPVYSEFFGFAITAVGNDRLLIGALYAEEGGYMTGAAFLFGTNGTLLTTITNPTPVYNDWFGCSVAAAGTDRLLIGALQDNTAGPGAGAAYVFSTNGTLITTITHTPSTGGWFGDAVAALGPELVIVATYADNALGPWAGAVYVCAPQSPFTPGLIADGVSDGAITAESLVTGAVTADKIAVGAVGSAELASDTASLTKVSGGKIGFDSAKLNLNDNLYLNDHDIYLRGDSFHGLGWYGSGKLFDGANVNGPALYGNGGGVLGWRSGGTDHSVLAWNDSGKVGIGTNNPAVRLDVSGTNEIAGGVDGLVNIGNSAGAHLTLDANKLQARNGASDTTLFLNRSGGNVAIGIGISSNPAKLDVNGDTRVRGLLRLGPETYPLEAPNPAGLVVRRVNSISQSTGTVVARTRNLNDNGDITLERDGTTAGFLINYPANPGNLTIACMGIDATGTARNFYTTLANPATAGAVQIYSNTLNVVHFRCTFGITYSAGEHLTEITFSRYATDNYWSGTLTSTYAQ